MFRDWECRLLSKPTPVTWAGFESNTLRLQQAGWEFSAEQCMASMRTRFLMRHQAMRFHGCSAYVDTDFFRGPGDQSWRQIQFPIQWMTGGDVRVYDNFDLCQPVDMQPQMLQKVTSMEDMALFAGASLARTNEIIVDPDSVADMLARISDLQDPARKEHFLQMTKEASREGRSMDGIIQPRQNFHAQIISLVA